MSSPFLEVCAAVESKLKLAKDWQTQNRCERCVFTVLFLLDLLVGGVTVVGEVFSSPSAML